MIIQKDNRVTVIANVHNRHRHLSRQLDYIQRYYEHILIPDSSSERYCEEKRLQGIDYYYYPEWDYVEKLCDVVKKVKTPYVHLCADDDFYVPDAVSACVDFLEENPGYYSAHGRYAAFSWNGDQVQFCPLYKNYIDRNINGESAGKRLRQLFRSYIQCLYAVHRTENLRDAFCLAQQNKIKNHNLVELLTAVTAAVNGKHRVLPVLYGVREKLQDSAGTFTPNIHVIMSQDEYRDEYERFLSLCFGYLSEHDRISGVWAQKLFLKALLLYVADTETNLPFIKNLSFHMLEKKARWLLFKMRHLCGGDQLGYIRQVDSQGAGLSRIKELIERHTIQNG